MRAHRKPPHAVPDCDRSRRAAHHRAARYRAAAPHAPRLCAAPRRAAPPSDTTAPRSPRRRRRSRCRTGRSSLAREPTRHRGALAKGRWSDHPAGACQKAWPQRTLDRADLRREKRQCAGSAGAGRREVSAVSALLARGRQASRAAERSRMWCLGRASQSDGCLAPPPAVRHGRVLCGRPWKGLAAAMDLARTRRGHVVELERTSRDRQISHQKKQSFLLRVDYGEATFLSGTTPAKTGEPKFHM